MRLGGILEQTYEPSREQFAMGAFMVWEYLTGAGTVIVLGNHLGQWLPGEGAVAENETRVLNQNRPNWAFWSRMGFVDPDLGPLPVYGETP